MKSLVEVLLEKCWKKSTKVKCVNEKQKLHWDKEAEEAVEEKEIQNKWLLINPSDGLMVNPWSHVC